MPCRAVDGAYDTRRCHTAILARGPTPIIPIRKNGRAWKEDCQAARARIRIEAKPLIVCSQTTAGQWMHCVKLLGQRLSARGPDRQTAEIHIRIALMNRFNALGTAEIIRTA
jgi:hypothetical protein